MDVDFSSQVSVPPHVLFREIDDEAVVLNLQAEAYFGLDAVGVRMWQLMTTMPSLESAYETLCREYDVAPGALREDMASLLGELLANGLLELADA